MVLTVCRSILIASTQTNYQVSFNFVYLKKETLMHAINTQAQALISWVKVEAVWTPFKYGCLPWQHKVNCWWALLGNWKPYYHPRLEIGLYTVIQEI